MLKSLMGGEMVLYSAGRCPSMVAWKSGCAEVYLDPLAALCVHVRPSDGSGVLSSGD